MIESTKPKTDKNNCKDDTALSLSLSDKHRASQILQNVSNSIYEHCSSCNIDKVAPQKNKKQKKKWQQMQPHAAHILGHVYILGTNGSETLMEHHPSWS